MEYLSKFDYSERIAEKRKTGKADDAIDIAMIEEGVGFIVPGYHEIMKNE